MHYNKFHMNSDQTLLVSKHYGHKCVFLGIYFMNLLGGAHGSLLIAGAADDEQLAENDQEKTR